eukprot:11089-Pelagomonas_calceolata.AAC.19
MGGGAERSSSTAASFSVDLCTQDACLPEHELSGGAVRATYFAGGAVHASCFSLVYALREVQCMPLALRCTLHAPAGSRDLFWLLAGREYALYMPL